MISKIVNHLIE